MVRAAAWLALSACLAGILLAVDYPERARRQPADSGRARIERTAPVPALALGSPTSPHRLVIFSDYQCSVCALLEREAGPALRSMASSGRLRLEIRHFPLSAHRRARSAAAHAVCAQRQHAGWRMHEALFAAAARWSGPVPSAPVFLQLADSLGLDGAAIARCARDSSIAGVLAADHALGRALGVTSVPALFLDDRPVVLRSPRALVRRLARLPDGHSP